MAKVNCRGRREVLRLHRERENGGWTQRSYGSDGAILARHRLTPESEIGTWSHVGRVKPDLSPLQIVTMRRDGPWYPVSSESRNLASPERVPDDRIGTRPIVTTRDATRRARATVTRHARAHRLIDEARDAARTADPPSEQIVAYVARHAGAIHVGENLRHWIGTIADKMIGGRATFALMPRATRHKIIHRIAIVRRGHRATYRAVMGHEPMMTERSIAAQILGVAR